MKCKGFSMLLRHPPLHTCASGIRRIVFLRSVCSREHGSKGVGQGRVKQGRAGSISYSFTFVTAHRDGERCVAVNCFVAADLSSLCKVCSSLCWVYFSAFAQQFVIGGPQLMPTGPTILGRRACHTGTTTPKRGTAVPYPRGKHWALRELRRPLRRWPKTDVYRYGC